MESRMRYHMPISLTRCPTGLLYRVNNFFASNLISKTLFNNAKNGANGNAATKIVTNPYCSTLRKIFSYIPSYIRNKISITLIIYYHYLLLC